MQSRQHELDFCGLTLSKRHGHRFKQIQVLQTTLLLVGSSGLTGTTMLVFHSDMLDREGVSPFANPNAGMRGASSKGHSSFLLASPYAVSPL
ncbi:hypothetical protein GY45DRAFT_295951 [Cubamyces sp. BRFM 1775]|nr:hypothetical protein GY45DRAFT_295951 [Cubamyces sp. BRFM 1775]